MIVLQLFPALSHSSSLLGTRRTEIPCAIAQRGSADGQIEFFVQFLPTYKYHLQLYAGTDSPIQTEGQLKLKKAL